MPTHTRSERGEKLFPMWFGVLGPPVIWSLRIGTSYVLVPYACWWEWVPVLHGVTAVALLGIAFAGWTAWKRRRDAGGGSGGDDDGTRARNRFMGLVGMFSSGFFALVVMAEGTANFLIDPCQTGGAPLP